MNLSPHFSAICSNGLMSLMEKLRKVLRSGGVGMIGKMTSDSENRHEHQNNDEILHDYINSD